ncbi:MAG TPA: signal peptide peptidase SppA [Ignavibacteriaceae bacterium]|nr:signal peptide peptidase SppA [Ignavibacteriaceae bacterium]
MKPIKIILLLIIILNFTAAAQKPNNNSGNEQRAVYYTSNSFWPVSPGAMKYGLYGYDNPALLSAMDKIDMEIFWTSLVENDQEPSGFSRWGFFTAAPHIGFGFVKEKLSQNSITDYKISTAAGNHSLSLGIAYGWSSGDRDFFDHSNLFTAGILYRPLNYLSIGLIGNFPTDAVVEGALDLALRPFRDEKISLFGDYVYRKDLKASAVNWSAGAAVELIPGIRFTGRYFEGKSFNAGIQLSLGNLGFSVRPDFDSKGKNVSNVYGIRIGGYDRNFFSSIFPKKNYVKMDLLGKVKYQRYVFFDDSKTLLNLLDQIDAAKNDKTVSGIAINMSGLETSREMIWELRKKLKDFKSSGKHIIVYIDRTGISGYHLASIADKIVIDPQGLIILEGYLFGRSYYKETLDKLGVGFTELRYFKYKSANETFSRTSMSEADSIQWQEIINDFYAAAKNDICEGRKIPPAKFDSLVNSYVYLPFEAIKEGLADKIGRWDEVKEMIAGMEGSEKNFTDPNSLEEFKLPSDNYWGEKPKIAVIYAVGVCAMDEGINARELSKDVEAVTENDGIKAVVFRVESPGGDALASDLVAEALRKCSLKKPVIVTQGGVAGSGGYWLSMYGDTILAAPNTITGSIGVIAGWYYNKGLKELLGVSTDYVKYGAHAELGYGFSLPIIGVMLPDRDLFDEEKKRFEKLIKIAYKDFVSRVALGRHMSEDKVDEIGQGRVWSGMDGVENGLVDKLGGLYDAINIAAGKADLKKGEYELIEYPKPLLIDLSVFVPKLIGIDDGQEKNTAVEDLKYRFKNNGLPLPMIPVDCGELIEQY